MMRRTSLLICAGLLLAACSDNDEETPTYEIWPEKTMENATYINNGTIQLGVDLKRGGAVFHFSEVGTKRNLLNHVDEGRFVQQSYYGEPDGSVWNGQPWVWNPVQGGGSHGEKARVLSWEVESTSLKVSSEPVLWASGKPVPECVMSEQISLDASVAHIRYTFTNRGRGARDHAGTPHQEVPAVFADWDLPNYVFYGGDQPWTGGELTSVVPDRLDLGFGNQEHRRTEHWAAYVDDRGWGIGVYTPDTELSTVYRFGSGPGGSGKEGPRAGSCSYFAPVRSFQITEGLVFTYDVYMMIGQVDDMRAKFYEIHRKGYSE